MAGLSTNATSTKWNQVVSRGVSVRAPPERIPQTLLPWEKGVYLVRTVQVPTRVAPRSESSNTVAMAYISSCVLEVFGEEAVCLVGTRLSKQF